MLTQEVTDSRAWTGTSLDEKASWYHALSSEVTKELGSRIRDLQDHPRSPDQALVPSIADLRLADSLMALQKALLPVRSVLETGRGFVTISGLPCEPTSPDELKGIYWMVGQLLGRPCVQNVQGTLLYDVRDTGQDLAQGARFSVTNYESSFHTDNSFGENLVDYVGLLCLQSAKSGGLSQLVSGYAVHNRLLADHADVLPILYQPFHVDRRGGVRPGEEPTIRKTILAWDGRDLVYRYLRHWIQSGHDKADCPLTSEQVRAMDVLDDVLRSPDLAAEFMLRPGEMLFINNRWILHNRTAFEDHPEPQRRRHYVRLWLTA